MSVDILVGDCVDLMRLCLPNQSVHCCVTSPPYFGLRDYGHDGQIGLEATPDAYVAKMVAVFREVRRVLRDDGTLWLNLGDSYSRSPAKGGSGPGGKNEDRWGYGAAQSARVGSSDGEVGRADRPGSRSGGLGEKQLLGIPWRVALALQADGWYLRQDIIWHKPNSMPESVRDRCTKAHEYIFLLSKSPRYYYDAAAIAEPSVALNEHDATGRTKQRVIKSGNKRRTPAKERGCPRDGTGSSIPWQGTHRNRRSVWSVNTKPFRGAHFATFPPDLIEPCVLAGCPVGGMVLDPFGGAGTTGLVAQRHGRGAVLCEINPGYAALAEARMKE